MAETIKQFEEIRNWAKIRGVGGNTDFHTQYQRLLQEIVEIHEAYIEGNIEEVKDAIGDSTVVLVNLASTIDSTLEECLDQAFNVIKLRKGLTTESGSFVRYAKLNKEDKKICDEKQGNPESEYFEEEKLNVLSEKDFKK